MGAQGGPQVHPPLARAGLSESAGTPGARRAHAPLASAETYAGAQAPRRRRPAVSGRDYRPALAPGHLLHEYRIERVLGSGGFGITYLATDTLLDGLVAIKEYLPQELAARDELSGAVYPRSARHDEDYSKGLTRFLIEARDLAALRHPGIVEVRRFFEINNTACMVMAYEQGESLGAWLSQRLLRGSAPPDEAQLVALFLPLLDGLRRVHEADFLHRDIKPAHIQVREADGSLVLLDFGAARQAGAAADAPAQVLSAGYAPYEQYHAHGRLGPWSDLYAVGAVLYWMVAGRRPIEALARVRHDPQQSAAHAGQGRYSEDFLAAIDWALAVDERARPQSVAELIAALTGEVPVARPEDDGAMGVMGVMGANGVTGSSGITEAIGVTHTNGVTDAYGITHTNDVARANGVMGAAHVPGAAALRASDEVLADAWPAAGYGERRAAQVIMDAEPSLVLGEQPEWPHDPQAPVLAQWGPTTVTKAEPVTVIDAGAPRPDGLARHEPAPRKPVWRKRTAAGVVLLLALGAGGYVSLRHGAGPGGQGAREPQAIKLGAPPVAR